MLFVKKYVPPHVPRYRYVRESVPVTVTGDISKFHFLPIFLQGWVGFVWFLCSVSLVNSASSACGIWACCVVVGVGPFGSNSERACLSAYLLILSERETERQREDSERDRERER